VGHQFGSVSIRRYRKREWEDYLTPIYQWSLLEKIIEISLGDAMIPLATWKEEFAMSPDTLKTPNDDVEILRDT